MAIRFTPDEEESTAQTETAPIQTKPIRFLPDEGSMSRKQLSNFGITEKTNAKQRQVITDAMRRRVRVQGFGKRPDGTAKGLGFFGELPVKGGGVATEFSVGVQLESRGGAETDIPSLVPTLTKEERDLLLNDIIPNRKPIPDSIIQKAVDHANKRVGEGKNVFAQEGEAIAERPPFGFAPGQELDPEGFGRREPLPQEDATKLIKRFGKKIANSFAKIGETVISSPLSPVGLSDKQIAPFREQARKELRASGFKGGTQQERELVRNRAAQLAAAEKVPKFKVDEAETIGEKAVDIVGGLGGFIAQLVLLRRVFPAGTPAPVIWEAQNQLQGGIPGAGAAMRLALGQVGRIPTGTALGKTGKVALESGLFAGTTAALGGDREDIIVSALIPIAFNAWGFAKQKRHIVSYEKALNQKALNSHKIRMQSGMNEAVSRAHLSADKRIIANALTKAKQRIYQDDAFAPAKEKWESERQKALRMIAKGGKENRERGNTILDFIGKKETVTTRRQEIDIPTTRVGEVVETIKSLQAEAKKLGMKGIKGLKPSALKAKIDQFKGVKALQESPFLTTTPTPPPTEATGVPEPSAEDLGLPRADETSFDRAIREIGERELAKAKPKKGTVAAKEVQVFEEDVQVAPAERVRKPIEPSKQQIETGEQFGLGASEVESRLHKAQLRYEELRSKPAADLKPAQKKELDFLTRKRTDLQALLGRDIKPLTRPQIEARAKQFGLPFRGRTTKAVLRDIVARAEEQRARGKPPEAVSITPDKLLKFSLQHEAKGARAGFRAGRIETLEKVKGELREAKIGRREGRLAGAKEIVEKHKELLEFAEANLPKGEFNLVVRAARMAVKSRTPGEIDKVVKAVNKMVENFEKASAVKEVSSILKKAKKLRPEFQAKVDAISDEFKLNKTREETLKKINSLLKAADLDMVPSSIPERLVDRAKEILSQQDKPLLRDFEADEIRAIGAAVGKIINENKYKNQFMSAKTQRTREEVIGPKNVDVDLETINRKLAKGEKLTAKEFILKVWGDKHELTAEAEEKGWLAGKLEDFKWIKQIATQGQLSYETIVWILSGEDSDAYNILYQNLQDATNKEADIVHDFREYMLSKGITNEVIQNSAKKGKGHRIKLPSARTEKGRRVPVVLMYNGELLDFNKLVMDPVKRANLLRDKMQGVRLGRQGKKGHSISISAEDMEAILKATPNSIKAHAESWHEYINGRTSTKYNLKDEVGKEWLKEHGYPLPQREHYSTAERYGEAIEKDIDPMRQFHDARLRDMNIFKRETRGTAPYVIRNGYGRMVSQTSRMAAYATKATVMNDALSILQDEGFRAQVNQAFKHGDRMLENMENTLRRFQGLDFMGEGVLSKAMKGFAPKMHVGALALKPYIMFYQPMSMINALNEIDAKYLLNMTRWRPSQVKRMRTILNEDSPTLRARDEASGAQVMNPVQAENALESFFGFSKKRLKGIHKTDSLTISTIGLGAEAEGKAKGLTGKALREYTVRRTEEIVLRTQPTWDPLTISQLAREGRDSALAHQFVMFSSQRAKNTNTTVREMVDYLQKKRLGKKASAAKVAKAFTLSQVAQSMAIWGLRALYFLALGKAIENVFGIRTKKFEKDWRYYVFGVVGQMLGNWLIVGDILDIALRKASGTVQPEARARGTIMFDTLFKSGKTIGLLQQGVTELVKDEKFKTGPKKGDLKAYYTFSEALETALQAAGPLTGTPTQSIAIHARPFFPHRKEVVEEQVDRGAFVELD